MKNGSFKEFIVKRRNAIIAGAAAIAVIVGYGVYFVNDARQAVLLASHIDLADETAIQEEETPLAAAPKVTTDTKTSTKTSTKKVKLSTASKKSYSKSLPATTKKSSKTVKKNNTTTVKTDTTTKTAVTEKYTKNSKQKQVTTKVTTTVKTTTTIKVAQAANTDPSTLDIAKAAPKMDARVVDAYKTLGFVITVNPSVNYSGYFTAKGKSITLKKDDDTIYHELGHFLGFIAGNYDVTSEFAKIYAEEKAKYTGYNKSYVNQNSSEYFAESVRDYTLNPSALKSSRPKTFAAIETALSKVTSAQVNKMKIILSMV